jgi:hypothetical protein
MNHTATVVSAVDLFHQLFTPGCDEPVAPITPKPTNSTEVNSLLFDKLFTEKPQDSDESFRLHGCADYVLDADKKRRCKCPWISASRAKELLDAGEARVFAYEVQRPTGPVTCFRKDTLVRHLTFEELAEREEFLEQEKLRRLFVRHASMRRDTLKKYLTRRTTGWADRLKHKLFQLGYHAAYGFGLSELCRAAMDRTGNWNGFVQPRHVAALFNFQSDFWNALLDFRGESMSNGAKARGATFATILKGQNIEHLANRRGTESPDASFTPHIVVDAALLPAKTRKKGPGPHDFDSDPTHGYSRGDNG